MNKEIERKKKASMSARRYSGGDSVLDKKKGERIGRVS